MSFSRSALLISCAALLTACSAPAPEETTPEVSAADFVGRWDMTIQTAEGSHPSWLEVTREGDQVSGRFVGKTGHARPVEDIQVEGAHLTFTLPTQHEEMESDLAFTGTLAEGTLSGMTNERARGHRVGVDGRGSA
jgi:hypothetical protein